MSQDRKKRKNQELAEKLLGSGRRSSAPNITVNRRNAGPSSLASRVGVSKVCHERFRASWMLIRPEKKAPPAARPNINGQWTHDLHHTSAPNRSASASRLERSNKIQAAIQRLERDDKIHFAIQRDATVNQEKSQARIQSQPQPIQLSIKGKANPGPTCVVASNFAAGTTEADIDMAFKPNDEILTSVRVLRQSPQVTAELVYAKREHAENIVAMFNGSMADGKQLYVFVKNGPPAPVPETRSEPVSVTPSAAPTPPARVGRSHEIAEEEIAPPDEAEPMEDVTEAPRPAREEPKPERNTYDEQYSRYRPPGYHENRYDYQPREFRGPRADYRSQYNARPRYEGYRGSGPQRWR